jgi:hypothetical protein
MMNKTTRMLILAGIILTSSTLASFLIYMATEKRSWLGFFGWMIFFASSQAPMLFVTRPSERACSGWWNRLRNRQ